MHKKLKLPHIVFCFYFLLISNLAFSQQKFIKKIEFVGSDSIPKQTLLDIIELEAGDLFNKEKLNNDIQNLKNTTIFSKVTATVTQNLQTKNAVDITFNLQKKWTFIPYFIFGTGGGTSYYSIGLFDSNFLNQIYTFNINYRIENSESNYSLSFTDNYSFHNKYITGINANYINKKITYYKDTQKYGYYSFEEHLLNIYSLYKFNPYFNFGGGFIYREAIKINEQLTNDEKNTNNSNKIISPTDFSDYGVQTRLQFGKMNYNSLTQEGITINNTTNSYIDDNSNDENLLILGFTEIPFIDDSYVGTRIGFQYTDSDNPVNEFYLGGLDKLRGFNYTQFTGKNTYYQNTEVRLTLIKGDYIAFQIVPFFDYGNASQNLNELFNNFASSYGVGIRIPLVKINKITFRLDYATTITPFRMSGFSLGLLQFF